MAPRRLVVELIIADEDLTKLTSIALSRTEPASGVERARMLLAYRDDPSFFAVGRLLGVHYQTVQRWVERAAAFGPLAALNASARPDHPHRSGPPCGMSSDMKLQGCEYGVYVRDAARRAGAAKRGPSVHQPAPHRAHRRLRRRRAMS